MNEYVFITVGFVILIGAFIPFLAFLRNIKQEKAQIIIDKAVIFLIVLFTLCDVGMLICYLLSEKYSAFPLFLSLSFVAMLESIFLHQLFALSPQILYTGIRKYNIEQLHVLSIEKKKQNRILIKAEITDLKSASKEITLWLTESNYQKYGAVFQKKLNGCQTNN